MAKPTKEEVIADAARFDEPHRSTMIALGEFQAGIPVDRSCAFCHTAIRVWFPNLMNDQVWQTACECGKCNSVCKGL